MNQPSIDPQQFIDGQVILIDKPLNWTSFNAVGKIKALLRHKLGLKKIKVGHAGTLDPLATGLLIICTGKMTKQIHEFQQMDKEYTGTFFLGATTPSSDLETKVDQVFPTDHITPDMIESAAKQLSGTLDQVPPLFSAKKIDGKRAYKHARKGDDIQLAPNKVTVHEFEILSTTIPQVNFRIVCSKGTYIRSLARDFGALIQSGAYLLNLRRTRIGAFNVEDAYTPEQLESLFEKQDHKE